MGCHSLLQGLFDPGIEPTSLALKTGFPPSEPRGEVHLP